MRPQPYSLFAAMALVAALASTPAAVRAQPAGTAASAPAQAPLATQAPGEWIEYDDLTVTPVVDDVSRDLAAARSALANKDNARAAASLQAAARALQAHADRIVKLDRQLAAADLMDAKAAHAKIAAAVRRIDAAAAQVKAGKVATVAALDKAIGKAQRANLESRWLVADAATWYPVSGEPQRHFGAAIEAYAKKDYRAAAAEVRKAAAYVRLEAARATGDAKQDLDQAGAALNKVAAALDKGELKAKDELNKTFAATSHALALAHRARAARLWARKAYDEAGYELKAAAAALDSAGAWVGAESKAAAASAAAGARTVGDKLAGGGVWARDEVAQAFKSLGNGLNELGRAIGAKHKATPVDLHA